nr:MAG TPA: hypothetical protein [Caudoviricetes sp.]
MLEEKNERIKKRKRIVRAGVLSHRNRILTAQYVTWTILLTGCMFSPETGGKK